METKSRYEIIENLEQQKRGLIREKNGFPDIVEQKEKDIKRYEKEIEKYNATAKDNLEIMRTDLEKFKESIKDKQFMMDELIKSLDKSLEMLNNK